MQSLNRKGIGSLVAILALILVSVLGVTTIWAYTSIFINELKFSPALPCIEMQTSSIFEIKNACLNTDGEAKITLTRSLKNIEIENLEFIFISDSAESTRWACGDSCQNCLLPNAGETKNYYFDFENPEKQRKVILAIDSCILGEKNIIGC